MALRILPSKPNLQNQSQSSAEVSHSYKPGSIEAVLQESLSELLGPKDIEDLLELVTGIHEFETRKKVAIAILKDVERRLSEKPSKRSELVRVANRKFNPVDIETFLRDPFYLGLEGQIYPTIVEDLKAINSGEYTEAVLTGGIGVAKTTIALWTNAYQLYLLSSLVDPQREFGLDKSSEILIVFQSLNSGHAKDLDYGRFRALIEGSPYFNKSFPFRKDLESTLKFQNRIEVRPIGGSETGAIGQNVIGGLLDELNFMEVTQNSKKAGNGGTYDQAMALYTTLANRRKSRFMSMGKMPGVLCLVSSKRYPGQFTDKKVEERDRELALYGKTTLYVYDKVIWEVKPDEFGHQGWFRMFTGTESKQPFIVEEDSILTEDDEDFIIDIPEEYRKDFESDPQRALRDIAGVSTMAIHPYMTNTSAIAQMFSTDVKSIFDSTVVDFFTRKAKIFPSRILNPDEPRWVHIDLATTGDSVGMVIGHITKFVQVERVEGIMETMPEIHIDGSLEVAPPKGGEILYHKVRALLYKLTELGMNIRWISFDGFQSTDSMQLLRQKGYSTGMVSTDTSTRPYEVLKQAVYDGRVHSAPHDKLKKELASLEMDSKRGKIDHPANGSKDVSDSLAGVVFGLTTRKEIWVRHKVSLERIPEILSKEVKTKDASADTGQN